MRRTVRMVRLYGTYPPVRILKAQLYETHRSSHDRAGIIRMNVTFHPISSTSCITSLMSLQQIDIYYQYPVNYYHVNNISCSYSKQWLHSKNTRANNHSTYYTYVPTTSTPKLQLTNLHCLHFLVFSVRISAVNNQSRDASNPARQHGDISVSGDMDRKQSLSLCFGGKKLKLMYPINQVVILTEESETQSLPLFFHLTQAMKPKPDHNLSSRLYG